MLLKITFTPQVSLKLLRGIAAAPTNSAAVTLRGWNDMHAASAAVLCISPHDVTDYILYILEFVSSV